MFIRRKVYSVVEDENGEQRLFSTTEFVNEGEYIKTFSDDKDKEDKKAKAKKAAKIAGIAGGSAVGAAGTGIGGSYLIGKALKNAGDKEYMNAKNAEQYAKALKKSKTGLALQAPGKAVVDFVKNPVISTKRGVASASEAVSGGVKKGADAVKNSKAGEAVSEGVKKGTEAVKNSKAGKATAEQLKKVAELIENNPKAYKALKVGGIGLAATGAAAGAGYGGYKLYKKTKAKKENKE